MAAAATTARVDPNGIRMEDGYQTLLAFELDADIEFWEKTVSPFGLDGEDEIPTSRCTYSVSDILQSFSDYDY